MIDREMAGEVLELLSVAIAGLMEDEHPTLVSTAKPGDAEAYAQTLVLLGSDISILAQALAVIVRRAEPEAGA